MSEVQSALCCAHLCIQLCIQLCQRGGIAVSLALVAAPCCRMQLLKPGQGGQQALHQEGG